MKRLSVFFLPALLLACATLPFEKRPAAGYSFGSDQPLNVAIIDVSGPQWRSSVETALRDYADAAEGHLHFQFDIDEANIVVIIRDYDDQHPRQLNGYEFPFGAGGFTTIYDTDGVACYYPPTPEAWRCNGEIASASVYLNNVIPAGTDLEERRVRLLRHEIGHALGLTRHNPELQIDQLATRYGWTLTERR